MKRVNDWIAHLSVWLLVLCCVVPALAYNAHLDRKPPDFERQDLTGRRIRLREYRGKVVLLNFWATWCAPCQQEIPRFEEWQVLYGSRGLQVIAVSMDDEAAPVRTLLSKLKVSYPVVMGDAKLGAEFGGVLGLPVTILIGRDGKIVRRIEGDADLRAMEDRIRKLLAEKAP